MLVGSREGDHLTLSALINSPHFAHEDEDGVSLFLSFLQQVGCCSWHVLLHLERS